MSTLLWLLACGVVSTPEVEVCDGVDQDGDGRIDEGAADAVALYTDADGDGFGGSLAGLGCEPGSGEVLEGTDCDDADATIHPDAEEVCTDAVDHDCDGLAGFEDGDADGVAACEDCDDAAAEVHPGAVETCDERDEDCDEVIDEDPSDEVTFYPDADGDGFGEDDGGITLCAWEAPSDWVTTDGDCDDADADIHPEQTEVCDDDIDEDCDGFAQLCTWPDEDLDLSLHADWAFYSTLEEDKVGRSFPILGGAVSDSFDVWVYGTGGPYGENLARFYFASLPEKGWTDLNLEVPYYEKLESEDVYSISNPELRDFDGDGFADLLMTTTSISTSVYLGPLTDLTSIADDRHTMIAASGLPYADSRWAEDLTGDGLLEVIGAEKANDHRFYLYDGENILAGGVVYDDQALNPDFELDLADTVWALDGVEDLTGDGYNDILVAAGDSGYDTTTLRVYAGPLTVQEDPIATIEGVCQPHDWAFDLDSEGPHDLLVLDCAEDTAMGFLGPISGALTLDDTDFDFPVYDFGFDYALRETWGVGDFDGDSVPDVFIDYHSVDDEVTSCPEEAFVGRIFFAPVLGDGDTLDLVDCVEDNNDLLVAVTEDTLLVGMPTWSDAGVYRGGVLYGVQPKPHRED